MARKRRTNRSGSQAHRKRLFAVRRFSRTPSASPPVPVRPIPMRRARSLVLARGEREVSRRDRRGTCEVPGAGRAASGVRSHGTDGILRRGSRSDRGVRTASAAARRGRQNRSRIAPLDFQRAAGPSGTQARRSARAGEGVRDRSAGAPGGAVARRRTIF